MNMATEATPPLVQIATDECPPGIALLRENWQRLEVHRDLSFVEHSMAGIEQADKSFGQ
jgi:hypothetical protein